MVMEGEELAMSVVLSSDIDPVRVRIEAIQGTATGLWHMLM